MMVTARMMGFNAVLSFCLTCFVACSQQQSDQGVEDKNEDAAVVSTVTVSDGNAMESSNATPESTTVETGISTNDAECNSCDTSTSTNGVPTSDAGLNTGEPSLTSEAATSPSGEVTWSDVTSNSREVDSTTNPTLPTSPPPITRWELGDALFTPTAIASVEIGLSLESEMRLKADPRIYVPGSLQVTLADGTRETFEQIGVRLKGQKGSARPLEQKAAFLLKINEYVRGQRLFGVTKLAVNNMVQDPTMMREHLAYQLFRAMDVPAPRTGYARVTLNDRLMGLYTTVEVVDNASFLGHWFGDEDGLLYEGEYGSDLEMPLLTTFDRDRGEDPGFAALQELTYVLDGIQERPPEEFLALAEPWIDIDGYLRFAAAELFMSHWDGYAATRNNYFIYRPRGGRWSWLPWGTDQTFETLGYPLWMGLGRVQQLCYRSLECRQKLAEIYGELIGSIVKLGLVQQVGVLESVLYEAALEDPRKEHSMVEIQAAIVTLRDYLRNRPGFVTSELFCTDPSNMDNDQDGVSACGGLDCNDNDPTIYSGAPELCNVIDDDCDGVIDNSPECPECAVRQDAEGRSFAFCFHPVNYLAAVADCTTQGGQIVSIHGTEQQRWLQETAAGLKAGADWWIGLDDRDTEGVFTWQDGSTVDFESWGSGEPNDWGTGEDCVYMTLEGAWNDYTCAGTRNYICALGPVLEPIP